MSSNAAAISDEPPDDSSDGRPDDAARPAHVPARVPGFYERPSKTRLKQASHELQDLGEAVLVLSDQRLQQLAMPESLLDAIRAAKTVKSHEGKRRQMQYIGKLMRRIDPEPIRAAVAELQLGRAQDSLALHRAERWRAELIADDSATTRWIESHDGTDSQVLRTLVRNARKDAALAPEKRSGRAYRELFQFIRQRDVAS